ncbi:hypothetical protein YO5_02638 [Stutzerimonas stutzeri TS44]|nr:hypothetical protein YO5_02638 [Stutzerimonas stutzeri TS44]
MSSFITQCPHCHTSFRVSHSQLGAARGAVRCGACLEVFNAARQLLAEEHSTPPAASASPAPQPPAAPPAPPAPSVDESRWIDDDLDLDSLDLDEELAKLEAQERERAQHFSQPAVAQPAIITPLHAEPDATAIPDTPRAAPEHDPRAAVAPVEAIAPAAAAAPPHLNPGATEPSAPSEPTPVVAAEHLAPTHDDVPPTRQEPAIDAPSAAQAAPAPERSPASQRHEPELANAPLFELDDEPLQLAWQQPRKRWGQRLAWGTLSLLALLGLAGQYVAYNFDELARQDRYRPWFEQLCPTLGCTLPSKVDVSQIRSSNLVVRSHPDFRGALVVDAILYNRAPFAQPFPLLEIRFADLTGKLIASRSFKPGEYLSGELAGQTEMPPQVPIHIALDILDPGSKAVNYSLSFQSPE